MKAVPRIVIVVIVLSAIGALFWWAWGRPGAPARLSGYVEGEALYLSSSQPGAVRQVSVVRGQRVAAGAPLFVLDTGPLSAQQAQAQAGVAAADARVADAAKGLRPTELSVYDAERAAAQATLRQAQAELNRIRPLVAKGIYAPARLDQVKANYDAAAANVRAIEARRASGTLGGRPDAVLAAQAQAAQARGVLAETQSRLAQAGPVAPAAGRIEDVYFQPGEWAAANQPVVALIPDDRVRVRFYVPERDIARYPVGTRVKFSCDGCRAGLSAVVNYVSPRPEFTPPVIYSRESRDRMVFLVEARPDNGASLIPGQPIDVVPVK
ncbi:HlyD family secretion protein [Caulobacter ginsengisoli]|uniref:HlyD family secretion protein n=1 Tax=Caulobacter ginsengisoli TaxID=400775 RepID=A0ABU0IYW4_9CAUL|nr:HlyD family efflux transporter periplasmic adaptor subunit [Caulobacter ginsengisoli]MDQ0466530.1 HlyD family secretion protein [Caulobacter ginsengisoli]